MFEWEFELNFYERYIYIILELVDWKRRITFNKTRQSQYKSRVRTAF